MFLCITQEGSDPKKGGDLKDSANKFAGEFQVRQHLSVQNQSRQEHRILPQLNGHGVIV